MKKSHALFLWLTCALTLMDHCCSSGLHPTASPRVVHVHRGGLSLSQAHFGREMVALTFSLHDRSTFAGSRHTLAATPIQPLVAQTSVAFRLAHNTSTGSGHDERPWRTKGCRYLRDVHVQQSKLFKTVAIITSHVVLQSPSSCPHRENVMK